MTRGVAQVESVIGNKKGSKTEGTRIHKESRGRTSCESQAQTTAQDYYSAAQDGAVTAQDGAVTAQDCA